MRTTARPPSSWGRAPWGRAVGLAVPYLLGSWLVLAAGVALAGSWRPTGDVAAMAVRSGDTFTRHIALVGMPSTAGEGLHHPGPLQLWVNGVADAVVGGRLGVFVATGLVNLAAIALIVSVGRHLGGGPGALAAAVACFLLGWSLYGTSLVSPLNPHAALHPLAAALVAGVSTAVRPTRWTLAGAVVFGSYAAQAHLVFAVLVLATSVPLAALAWRNAGRPDRPRLAALAAVLGVSAWIGPIVDIVVHEGGNLRVLAGVVTGDDAGAILGISRAVSVLAGAIAPTPIFLARDRSGAEVFVGASGPWTVVVVVALALLAAEGLRRRATQPLLSVAAVTTAVLAVASVLAIGRFPSFALNAFALHNYLPLWIVSIAVWGLIAALTADVLVRVRPRGPRSATGGAALTVVAMIAVVASSIVGPRPAASPEMAYVESLARQLDAHLGEGPHLLAVHDDLLLFGVDAGLVQALRDAGHDIVVPERVGQSFGEHHVVGEPATTLTVGLGGPPGGAEVVAEHRPDPEVVRRREAAVAELTDVVLADPGLVEEFTAPDSVSDRRSAARFVRDDLAGLATNGLLRGPLADHPATRTLARIAEQAWQSLYVEQVPGGDPGA